MDTVLRLFFNFFQFLYFISYKKKLNTKNTRKNCTVAIAPFIQKLDFEWSVGVAAICFVGSILAAATNESECLGNIYLTTDGHG